MIQSSRDVGLYSRFAAACLATSEAVLIQDDDIFLPPDTVTRLVAAWQADPGIVHGIHGRKPRPDGTYAVDVRGDVDCPIVLTRCLVVSRWLCGQFWRTAQRFEALQETSHPHGNGEDMLLSYTARKLTGRLNRVHALPFTELPAPAPIHGRKGHVAHRTLLMQSLETWLEEG